MNTCYGPQGDGGGVTVTTPLGFFQQEVSLFWTLIAQTLGLQVPIPLRLRPETEQMLAQRLWEPYLEDGGLEQLGTRHKRQVRRALDLLQLAGAAGLAPEEIGERLQQGLASEQLEPEAAGVLQEMLLQWRDWCLRRGGTHLWGGVGTLLALFVTRPLLSGPVEAAIFGGGGG